MKLTIGADPEVFLISNGQFASAYGLVSGTKKAPHKVRLGATQVDGMAAEFNIDPAANEDQFVGNIQTVMDQLRAMIPSDMQLAIEPVAHFPWDVIQKQPAEALELGCDPDFCAYTMAVNERPDGSDNMRTAAGHVHLGFVQNADTESFQHFAMCCELSKQLDFTLGLPSVLLDKDTERKKKYGKAGCFRPKPYGVEYRVLSNFWLRAPELMRRVYNNTVQGFNWFIEGRNLTEEFGSVDEIINTNNRSEAERLVKAIGIAV